MLQISELEKAYGDHCLFSDATFTINKGERVGLVGRNGHGKSTLMRIITQEETPDRGTISTPKGYRIGALSQHLSFSQPSVLEEAALGLPDEDKDHLYKVETILSGLGFSEADFSRPVSDFSGGFQIRIHLTKVLVSEPDLLLLDEPTNYLDIVSLRWLERFLSQWKGEILLITHDRTFMDRVTTHTIALHRGQFRKVKGGTEKVYTMIAEQEEIHEKSRAKEEKRRKEIQANIDRFKAKASKASAAQSKQKQLDKRPALEKLMAIENLALSFPYRPLHSKHVVKIADLSFAYPDSSPLFKELCLEISTGDRVAIIGKNGKGKTTLLRLIAQQLTPLTGEVTFHNQVETGYFGQTHIDRLNSSVSIIDEVALANPDLSTTEVRSICGAMMFDGNKAKKKISVLSGGERSRVLLGKLLCQPSNVLLLDEPTNHLDIESVEALVSGLEAYEGTLVFVTHDEMILSRLANKLIVLDGESAQVFHGDYPLFLEKGGWGDGETHSAAAVQSSPTLSRKEIKRRRAELQQERSRTLSPLRKAVDRLENEITTLEMESSSIERALIAAAEEQDGQKIKTLSQENDCVKKKIDRLFVDLEKQTDALETADSSFQERIAQLDDIK